MINKNEYKLLQKEFKTKNYAKILLIILPNKNIINKNKINKTLNVLLKTYNITKANIYIKKENINSPKWIFKLYIKQDNKPILLRTDKYEGVFKI